MAKKLLCTQCQTVAKPKLVTKGNIIFEIILWLCFIVPGLLYSIWRHSSRYYACPTCGAPNMIPLNSPAAKKIMSGQLSDQAPLRTPDGE